MNARHPERSTSGWPSTLFVGDQPPSPYRVAPPPARMHWAAGLGLRLFAIGALAVQLGFSAGLGWAAGKALVWVLDRAVVEFLELTGVLL